MRSENLKNRNLSKFIGMAMPVLVWLLFLSATAFLWAVEIKEDRQVSAKKPVKIASVEVFFEKLKGLTLYKGKVTALHGDVVLTADEISAFSENNAATAKGHVKLIDKSSGITLTCGSLEYQGLMDSMTAHDHPVLTSEDQNGKPLTILGRQMELDLEKKIIVVNQNVLIVQSESKAEAQKATFLSKENQMILEDDPKVYTSNAQITGRRITTNMGEGKGFLAEGLAEVIFNPTGEPLTVKSGKDDKDAKTLPGKGNGSERLSPKNAPGPRGSGGSPDNNLMTPAGGSVNPTPVVPPGSPGHPGPHGSH